MSGSSTQPSRYSLSWVLRAVVAAGVAAVLLIDLYHRLSPSASGVPIWVFPFIPVIVFAGPGALVLLVAETVVTLKKRAKMGPLLIDTVFVALWLLLWFSHL